MIPTIEQIVADLIAGTVTKEQAIAWLKEHVDASGMRDFFAAAALQGLCTSQRPDGEWAHGGPAVTSKAAYDMADGMLAERAKR